MSLAYDTFRTLEPGSLVLQLRDGLRSVPQRFGPEVCVVIGDEATGRCFRVSREVADFVFLLDGRRTVSQALAITATRQRQPVDEDEAVRICAWLIESELATTPAAARSERVGKRRRVKRSRALPGKLNPIAFRVPLFDPAPLLRLLAPIGRAVFSWPGLLAYVLLLAYAAVQLLPDAGRLLAARPSLASTDLWAMVALFAVGLKVLHELAHGLACQAIGCRPRQAGVLILLMVPLPFVDVTASWLNPSKYRRMLVSAAGMMAELAVAALALLVWQQTDSPVLAEAMIATATAAAIVTVLFNANPLMKFDGYYLLADWLEMPNLAGRAHAVVKGLAGRLVGLPFTLSDHRRWPTLLLYGAAATCWKLVIWASIMTAACLLFHRAGRILAVVATALMLGLMVVRAVRRVGWPKPSEPPVSLARLGGCFAAVAVTAGLVAAGVTRPAAVRVTAIVVPQQSTAVQPRSTGFVREVLAADGDRVAAGDVLIRLSSIDLDERVRQLELELTAVEQEARGYRFSGEIAAAQATDTRAAAIAARLDQTARDQADLTIRAAAPGVVRLSTAGATELVGQFVRPGQTLATIDSPDLEAVAVLDESDAEQLRLVHDWSVRPRADVAVERVETAPRTSRALPHPLLGSDAGGPLAVRPGPRGEAELASPAVRLRIAIDSAQPLRPGTRLDLRGALDRPIVDDLIEQAAAVDRLLR